MVDGTINQQIQSLQLGLQIHSLNLASNEASQRFLDYFIMA